MDSMAYPRKWLALIGIGLVAFTAFLDATIVNTALPAIQLSLKTNILQLQWVINVYTLVLSMLMITSGRIADIFGRRRVFYFGAIIFSMSALCAGFSNSITFVIFFRALQGVGGSVMFPIALALLSQAFPADEHPKAIGIYSAITGSGLALGPFIGGALTSLLSWRWVFFINVPIIIIGLLCCFVSVPKSPILDAKPKIDWWGFLFLILGIGGLVYGIIHGEAAGWQNAYTIVSLVVAAIALPMLIIIERNVAEPMLMLRIFSNKKLMIVALTCTTAGIVTFVLFFFNPLYLSIVRGLSPFYTGLTLMAMPLMQIVLSLSFHKLYQKFSLVFICLAAIFTAVIASFIQYSFDQTISYIVIIVSYLLAGVIWGTANTVTPVGVNETMPQDKIGNAIGTIFTSWTVSGSIWLAIAAVIVHARERTLMAAFINKAQLNLTVAQQRLVQSALSNPSHATKLLSQLDSQKKEVLFNHFKLAFLSGFHLAILVMSLFLVLLLLGTLALALSESSIKNLYK